MMVNALRCYSSLGRLNEAECLLGKIKELAPDDIGVRVYVDQGVACVAAQAGREEEAVLQFGRMLREYAQLMATANYLDLYEDIQLRRPRV
jgi:tetratricopeptide (TPR) repeat protein